MKKKTMKMKILKVMTKQNGESMKSANHEKWNSKVCQKDSEDLKSTNVYCVYLYICLVSVEFLRFVFSNQKFASF